MELTVIGCMSKDIIEKALEIKLNPPKIKNTREECNCLMGNDIGEYNTCMHLCKYCYANANKDLVIENVKRHIETSPLLIGNKEEKDKISEAKQKSWINNDNQLSLFL